MGSFGGVCLFTDLFSVKVSDELVGIDFESDVEGSLGVDAEADADVGGVSAFFSSVFSEGMIGAWFFSGFRLLSAASTSRRRSSRETPALWKSESICRQDRLRLVHHHKKVIAIDLLKHLRRRERAEDFSLSVFDDPLLE